MKQPVDHILRPRLPWRSADEAPITECGFDATKVTTLTREDFARRLKEMGQQRTALFTCMTCADTASRWGTWDDDPRLAMQREIEWERVGWRRQSDKRGERLKDELTAIADLIAAHRDEFDSALSEIGQRREWNQKKAELAKKPKASTL